MSKGEACRVIRFVQHYLFRVTLELDKFCHTDLTIVSCTVAIIEELDETCVMAELQVIAPIAVAIYATASIVSPNLCIVLAICTLVDDILTAGGSFRGTVAESKLIGNAGDLHHKGLIAPAEYVAVVTQTNATIGIPAFTTRDVSLHALIVVFCQVKRHMARGYSLYLILFYARVPFPAANATYRYDGCPSLVAYLQCTVLQLGHSLVAAGEGEEGGVARLKDESILDSSIKGIPRRCIPVPLHIKLNQTCAELQLIFRERLGVDINVLTLYADCQHTRLFVVGCRSCCSLSLYCIAELRLIIVLGRQLVVSFSF